MVVILLGGLLAGQPLAQGQDKKEDKPNAQPRAQQDAGALIIEGRIRQMDKALALTEEQKQKLRPIFAEEAKTLSAVRDDSTLPIETRIAKRKEINAATQTKIKPILTPEQVEKWEKQQSRARKTTK